MLHLPDILREGVTKGGVFLSPTRYLAAPHFTTNGNPRSQDWIKGSGGNKVKVRLTVDFSANDPQLQSWRQVCKARRVDRKWAKSLAPTGQGKFWYLYFGNVHPEHIKTVEILEQSGYRPYRGERLARLLSSIREEKKKLDIWEMRLPYFPVPTRVMKLKEGYDHCWLLDGSAPIRPLELSEATLR
jgi:hypothetical protein